MTRMLVGMETKRREKYFSYFSFDAATYRGWMKHANVWLKPDDTDGHADSDNTNEGDDGKDGNHGNDENKEDRNDPFLHVNHHQQYRFYVF